MILAGGQGSRLGALTKHVAKPAVSFGGKYKIIDFVLSNCSNSGIDTVGVLTQYKPLDLNAHIGIGTPWDLDMHHGGVTLLPPYMHQKSGSWYKGTANAVYQNLSYLEQYQPDYVLILSGDHIYTMNYGKMLQFHKEKKADVTVASIDVSEKEAKRFGILTADTSGKILEFEEKPAQPKSRLASMGIYIFTYEKLKEVLTLDEKDPNSANDFGKNILPYMLQASHRVFTYRFEGYWRDIGTIESIWEANMDLIRAEKPFDIFSDKWKIYTKSRDLPPQYIASTATIRNSMISEGCRIYGQVENSILFPGVTVLEHSRIADSIVMSDATIESHVEIQKAIICPNVHIPSHHCIGNGHRIEVWKEGVGIAEHTTKRR